MPRSAEQTEELANAASHGLSGLLALVAWPALAAPAVDGQPVLHQAGVSVFGLTMLLMFVASTLYHAAPAGPARHRLRRLDHAAIYLFIAGSCTPFALGAPDDGGQWLVLAGVWALALAGMAAKLTDRLRQPLASTLLYLGFGWLAGAAALPALSQLSGRSLAFLVAGGLAYSVGCGFFLLGRRMRYGHLVWHLFVMAGCSFHLLALLQMRG